MYYVTPEDDTRQNGCLQKTVTQLYTLYCVYWLYSITSIHFIQYHASFKVVEIWARSPEHGEGSVVRNSLATSNK